MFINSLNRSTSADSGSEEVDQVVVNVCSYSQKAIVICALKPRQASPLWIELSQHADSHSPEGLSLTFDVFSFSQKL